MLRYVDLPAQTVAFISNTAGLRCYVANHILVKNVNLPIEANGLTFARKTGILTFCDRNTPVFVGICNYLQKRYGKTVIYHVLIFYCVSMIFDSFSWRKREDISADFGYFAKTFRFRFLYFGTSPSSHLNFASKWKRRL